MGRITETLHEPAAGERPGFWSPHLKQERKMWAKMSVIFFVLLTVIILGILSIYWGADHSLMFNLDVATIAVIDLDGQEVGPAVQSYAQQFRRQMGSETLGYITPPQGAYTNNEEALAALKNEDFWAGVVVQSNATALMNYAYTAGNASYDPTGAIHVIYTEARNALVIGELIYPQLSSFLQGFQMQFAKQKQSSLLLANAQNVAALTLQAETPIPISFSLYNRAPYVPTTVEAATEIGTIYLIIVAFISVLMFGNLNQAMLGKVSLKVYVAYRMLLFPTVYFFLSLLYTVLSAIWHVPLRTRFGAGGFPLFWMLSWVSMTVFGLVMDGVNNLFGPPITPVFFAFWVISNVATGFYPVEFLSNFYRWGLAWPLRHNLIAAKTIIFLETKNELGLNFGVILAWAAVAIVLQPFTLGVQIYKMRQMWQKNSKEMVSRMHDDHRKSASSDSNSD